ncbi:periplasmic heavy metal sensor [Solidesulfovibrio sp. C21]|uniref:periplasmic heavy metal sensor n=1 Tax=Solidesulfovibrio sp. C21 TaxID=3398613 RepID=UPI0039FC2ED9
MVLRKLLATTFALAAIIVFGSWGSAGAQMGPGMMSGYGYQNLTPEKQAAAQKIYGAYYSQTRALRQQLVAKQYELNALIYGGKADDKKVQELTGEVSQLRSKLYEAQVALQRQLAKEDLPFMGGMHGGGMHGGGMYGGGMYGGGMMGPGMGMY